MKYDFPRAKTEDRRNAMGVHVYKDAPTEFSYIIGWEETSVTFKIAEIQVED